MNSTFTLDELATLTSYSKRTIRYYVQLGLVDRPLGDGRGAHYTTDHLRELLDIRKLTDGGLSLEAARAHLRRDGFGAQPPAGRRPGAIQVQSRVCLAPGLDLLISPDESAMPPDEVRWLTRCFITIARNYLEPISRPDTAAADAVLLALGAEPFPRRKARRAPRRPAGGPAGDRDA
jgi:DNA-binding transcriptional MerR regulator